LVDITNDAKVVAVTACRVGVDLQAKRAGIIKILEKPV